MIRTEGLSKRFGATQALDRLNLHVKQGSATALVGANGAGKTTALRLIMNLIRPDAGHAQVLGVDSRSLSPDELRRIGYVAESQKLPPVLKLGDYLAYLARLYPTWETDLAASLVGQLRLDPGQKLGRMSHGTRIKAALVGALAYRPELLILDEPLGGLDPNARDQLLEGLLGHAEGTTILISSHELYEIEGAVTDIAFLDNGRLRFQEPLEDLGDRFRDVAVVLGGDPRPMPDLPPAWIAPRLVGRTLAFTATDFTNEDDLKSRIAQRAGPVQSVETSPMPLRAIAKALMQDVAQERPA